MLFLFALVFVNSKKVLSLFFQLGFCWMIWYQLKRSTPIPITTSAQMGLPWVCLGKTMLLLFELVFVISNLMLSFLFHIGLCWLIWTDEYRYARVFLAWYWNFRIEIVSHVVQRAFLCLVQAFEVIPTKQQTFIFKRETELHTLAPRARIYWIEAWTKSRTDYWVNVKNWKNVETVTLMEKGLSFLKMK